MQVCRHGAAVQASSQVGAWGTRRSPAAGQQVRLVPALQPQLLLQRRPAHRAVELEARQRRAADLHGAGTPQLGVGAQQAREDVWAGRRGSWRELGQVWQGMVVPRVDGCWRGSRHSTTAQA